MANFTQQDIRIWYVDDNGREHPLPYAFHDSTPCFRWEVPTGFRQRKFIFEMRTTTAKEYSLVINGEPQEQNMCLYWNSGVKTSTVNEYRCSESVSVMSDYSSDVTMVGINERWLGLCEIRLRIIDQQDNEICTHAKTTDAYDFERKPVIDQHNMISQVMPDPQGRKWGSMNDSVHFFYDNDIDRQINAGRALLQFVPGYDTDSDDTLSHLVQISDTPLFDAGLHHQELYQGVVNANEVVLSFDRELDEGVSESSSSSSDDGTWHLKYDHMYYCRVRAYDGFDYSDWSETTAFTSVFGSPPRCYINSVSVPNERDETGLLVPSYRSNGELIVNIRVEDDDSKFVKAWLLFSMKITEEQLSILSVAEREEIKSNGIGVLPSYGRDTQGRFIRAITKESLIKIPTNKNLDVTWCSNLGLSGKLCAGKIMQNVYLYLFAVDDSDLSGNMEYYPQQIAFDGYVDEDGTAVPPRQSIGYNIKHNATQENIAVISRNASGGIDIDNRLTTNTGTSPQISPPTFKVHGELQWMLRYPVLPDTMQRSLIVSTPLDDQGDGEGEGGEGQQQNKVGGVGYSDGTAKIPVGSSSSATFQFNSLYDLVYQAENAYGRTYLQRITQTGAFSIKGYRKYDTYYSSTSSSSDWMGVFEFGVGTATQFNSIANGTVGTQIGTVSIYNQQTGKMETREVYDEYSGGEYAVTETYGDSSSSGFVMLCPECNSLHILQTKIVLQDNRVFNSPADAFGENGERFDGTPYKLMFWCPNCNKLYDMGMKYQTGISTSIGCGIKKDNHVFWHGYNSGERILENTDMQRSLMLTSEHDFAMMVLAWREQYKEEHGTYPKDDECPYRWIRIIRGIGANGGALPEIVSVGDDGKVTININGMNSYESSGYRKESYGLFPDDALLKLNPKPEFDSYVKVVPPRALSYHENIYNDGAKLNASIEQDYMHDFESNSSEAGGNSSDNGDDAMTHLAAQGPWWVQNRMMYQFFEGKKSLQDETAGYSGVNGGGDDGNADDDKDEKEGEGLPGSGDANTGIVEYRVLGTASKLARIWQDGGERTTGTYEVPNRSIAFRTFKHPTIGVRSVMFNRMSCAGLLRFPIVVKRGVNDMVRYHINDGDVIERSVLGEGLDELRIEFPYQNAVKDSEQEPDATTTGIYKYTRQIDQTSNTLLLDLLRNALGAAFVIDEWSDDPIVPKFVSYTMKKDYLSTIEMDDGGRYDSPLKRISLARQTIAFSVYGNTDTGVDGLSEGRYQKFELLGCDHSCYDQLGIVPFVTSQSMRYVFGSNVSTDFDGQQVAAAVTKGTFPKGKGGKTGDDYANDEQFKYYYTARETTKHEFHAQENPIDNDIESFVGCDVFDSEGNVRHASKYRKPSTVTTGEPLFTCYRDEVDSRGFHFKFTEEDYRKTGKIYVRRYHVEDCNPFPYQDFGYRNWIVVPIEGKDGRYHKKKVFNFRGAPAVPKMIKVELSPGEEPIEEIGWFASEEATEPFSHDPPSSSSSATTGTEPEEKVYIRKPGFKWRNKMLPKTCVVFDYVDISEAMCKNPFTPSGTSPFNHICPINFGGGVYKELFIKRYGLYVMGSYDLTDQQKSLPDDSMPYEQTYEYVDKDGSSSSITATLPNNWRPVVLDAKFDSVQDEASSFTVVDLSSKRKWQQGEEPSPNDFDHGQKSIESYKRYEKTWKKHDDAIGRQMSSSSYVLSQRTVEQFNPAFVGAVGITEKWGYMPKNTFQEYWKEDKDKMYVGRYLPLSSKLVHGIYHDPVTGEKGDPFADMRLVGEIMRERYIISDKSFKRVDDTYDRLPFLDYRLVGRMTFDMLPYFSGYPRDEHPLYATRPEPPYPYDRQWRIGGWKVRGTDVDGNEIGRQSFEKQMEEERWRKTGYETDTLITVEPKRKEIEDLSPGASIAYPIMMQNNIFLYLQKEWNSYNRIHWTMDVGKGSYVALYAAQVFEDGTMSPKFSVKTYSSFWNESFNAWFMPYDDSLSDMIDMSDTTDEQGNSKFIDGMNYKFSLASYIEEQDGSYKETVTDFSNQFSISHTAQSPATIVSTDYNAWTKMLTINFRFDDVLGRKYDITGFRYIAEDREYGRDANGKLNGTITYKGREEFIVPGGGDGTGVLIGNIHDLASNVKTKTMLPDELLITHSLQVNVAGLGIKSASNMRVMLDSDLSINRAGFTLPVFTVKMWANEFLKPIEEQMMSLLGYKTQWVRNDTYDENTGEMVSEWEYLDEKDAITTIGRIQETQEAISGISDKFEQWHNRLTTVCSESLVGGGDIDLLELWLKKTQRWNDFYYGYFFRTYLFWHQSDAYESDYLEYEMTISQALLPTARAKRWLEYRKLASDYSAWYLHRRVFILLSYRASHRDLVAGFENDFTLASDLSEARVEFAETLQSAYDSYYRESVDASASEEGIEVTPEHALAFIEDGGYQKQFISYYTKKNAYADTRFLERSLVLNTMFGIVTEGVWEKERNDIPQAYRGKYREWIDDPSNNAVALPLSDCHQAFLEYALNSQVKLNAILGNGEEGVVVDVPYASTTIIGNATDIAKATIENVGRTLAMKAFLQTPAGNGTTYSQKWQALNNTLSEYRKLLLACQRNKNILETDFRKNLIRQGFFCNGFVENQPYSASQPAESTKSNMCFRWRVETRQYEGKMDSSYDANSKSFGSFDPRYNMYYHFQMDFYDTFDSQEGKPVNDILFILDGKTDNCRILAGIDDADNTAATSPLQLGVESSSATAVTNRDSVVDRTENEKLLNSTSRTRSNIDLQFTATFGIPLDELPTVENATPPTAWRQCWRSQDELDGMEDDPRTDEPENADAPLRNLDFKSTYYWRVAPYNIVERPVFETLLGGTVIENGYVVLDCLFHSEELSMCKIPGNGNYLTIYKATMPRYLQQTISNGVIRVVEYNPYFNPNPRPPSSSTSTKYVQCPVWKTNCESKPFCPPSYTPMPTESEMTSQYDNSAQGGDGVHLPWMKFDREKRGEVQFLTDRPRKVAWMAVKSESAPPSIDSVSTYSISAAHGFSEFPSELQGKYDRVEGESYYQHRDNQYCLYRATMNGSQRWFLGANPKDSEQSTSNADWLYYSSQSNPYLIDTMYDLHGSDVKVNVGIVEEGEGEQDDMTMEIPVVSYVKDNIGNFDTEWIPSGVERMKPSVIRFGDHYLMFSHKRVGTVKNGDSSRASCMITMSRGFSSDIFGEECQCFPPYAFQSVGDIVKDSVAVGQNTETRNALSVENPCVIPIGGGVYRMYFNAVFHDGTGYYQKIFKADTIDFDDWTDISPVALTSDGEELLNCLEPNVTAVPDGNDGVEYVMFIVSFQHSQEAIDKGANASFTTIKEFRGSDGLAFSYRQELYATTDGGYSIHSPSLLVLNDYEWQLYFSIESNPVNGISSSVIGSVMGSVQNGNVTWREEPYLDTSRIILEKSDMPFVVADATTNNTIIAKGNVVATLGRVFDASFSAEKTYSNPFVMWDYFNGCRVRRMYYNTKMSPYLWDGRTEKLFAASVVGESCEILEYVICTEYLEEWTWSSTSVNNVQYLAEDGTWKNINYSDNQNVMVPASPNGDAKIRFSENRVQSDYLDSPAVMIKAMPIAHSIRCMAEGKWIGYDNVANTEAMLKPEINNEVEYSLSKYLPTKWIAENHLTEAYNEWLHGQDSSSIASESTTSLALQWLKWSRNYPRYLWWSRKGPGIYRYVGYDMLKNYTWMGSTKGDDPDD